MQVKGADVGGAASKSIVNRILPEKLNLKFKN